jgi:hypothetical protein
MSLPRVEQEFEAPELKLAVKRMYGGERAPLGLRQRVETILAAPVARPARMRIERPVMWQWAAAAMIMVGLGGLVARVNWERHHPVGGQTLAAMVKIHDYCCREGNKHQQKEIPQESFALIGQTMAQKLEKPVLAANLEGWKFVGAAMCPINGKNSAHLVYHRGGQRLSVFSLPASACDKVREGGSGCEVISDHVVAGFAKTGGVYCIVATCPQKKLEREEIQQLLQKHRGNLVAPKREGSVAMVELVRQR